MGADVVGDLRSNKIFICNVIHKTEGGADFTPCRLGISIHLGYG